MVFWLKISIASSIGPQPMGGRHTCAQSRLGHATCFDHLIIGIGLEQTHFFFFSFLGLHPQHTEVLRLVVKLELQAARLRHSHSNAGSELLLRPTPQFTATSDP